MVEKQDPTQAKVDRHAQIATTTVEHLLALLWAAWTGFTATDWWDEDLINGAAAKSVSNVTMALKQTRLTQRSFSSSILRQMNALPRSLPSLQNDYPRFDVDPFEVYSRPAQQYQYAFSQTSNFEEARDVAKTRVDNLGQMDLLKARMDESRTILEAAPMVIGTRRIIHPELSRGGTCGLCAVAATRFYKASDLQPLHGGCECTTLPITKTSDPGLKLNQDDLNQLYGAAGGSTFPDALKQIRVSIHSNGQLGPILTSKGDVFQGPAKVGVKPFSSAPLTPAERVDQLNKRLDELQPKILHAQSSYQASLGAGTAPQDAVALFRAIKQLTDYEKSLQQQLGSARGRRAA